MSDCARRLLRRNLVGLAFTPLVGLFLANAVWAVPRLVCEVSQGGETQQLQFGVTPNPYDAEAQSINERFRLKVVMVPAAQGIAYINIYAYYLSANRPVLLQQAKYLLPKAQQSPSGDALTGRQYLYSPDLGRELVYQCALIDEAL